MFFSGDYAFYKSMLSERIARPWPVREVIMKVPLTADEYKVCCTKAQLTKESQARMKTIIGARRKLNHCFECGVYTPMGFLCVCGEAVYCSKACSKKYWKKVANPCPCKVKSN